MKREFAIEVCEMMLKHSIEILFDQDPDDTIDAVVETATKLLELSDDDKRAIDELLKHESEEGCPNLEPEVVAEQIIEYLVDARYFDDNYQCGDCGFKYKADESNFACPKCNP